MSLTIEQRADIFSKKIIEGESQSDAYRAAYPSSVKWSDNAVHVKACEFAKHDKVLVRLNELQQQHQTRHNVTVDSLIIELEEARSLAMESSNGASSAVSAIMGKAKICGYLIDNTKLEGRIDGSFSDGMKRIFDSIALHKDLTPPAAKQGYRD